MTTSQLAKFRNFFVYYPIWTFSVLKQVPISPKVHWKRFQVDRRWTAVFMQHRVLKPYKARCAKNVIAYKMKTVHDKAFLKALLICKLAISYTFGIMLRCDIFTPSSIYWPPIIFTCNSENQKIRKFGVWK